MFQARVFPIPPSGDKELIIAWSQELANPAAPYALPLVGLPKMRTLQVAVHVHTGGHGPSVPLRLDKRDYQPPVDLLVRRAALHREDEVARAGDLAVARVTVPAATAEQGFGRTIVLFDTSASEALGFEVRIERLRQVLKFAAERGATAASVVLFDQVTATAYSGPPAGFDDLAAAKVQARGALGASDLGLALDAAHALAGAHARADVTAGPSRVLLLSNVLPTAGLTDGTALAAKVKALAAVGVERLDVVTQSSARDEALAKALVTAGLPHAGTTVAVGSGTADFAPLGKVTLQTIDIAVDGAEWVFPEHVDGVQPGESILVYASVPATRKFQLTLSGGTAAQPSLTERTIEGALLDRAAMGARIRRLEGQLEGAKDELASVLKDQIVDLSVRNRVLSRHTALLVLENDAEYARYQIDQKALASILFVTGEGRTVLADRTAAYGLVAIAQPQPSAPSPFHTESAGMYKKAEEPAPGTAWEIAAPQGRGPPEPADLDRDLQPERVADRPASAGAQADPAEAPRQARAAVERNTIAGAFLGNASATKLFAEAGEGEEGDVVAKSFGGAGSDEGAPAAGLQLGGASGGGTMEKVTSGRSRGFGERRADEVRFEAKKEEATVRVGVVASEMMGGGEGRSEVARMIKRKNSAVQRCFEMALRDDPDVGNKVKVTFTVGTEGTVTEADIAGVVVGPLSDCIQAKYMAIRGFPLLPAPQSFSQSYLFTRGYGAPEPQWEAPVHIARPRMPRVPVQQALPFVRPKVPHNEQAPAAWVSAPNTPELPGVHYERLVEGLRAGAVAAVLAEAKTWRKDAPTELLALVALGRALHASGNPLDAARAFGSLLDLYPGRADLRRYAGNLLESLGDTGAALALDTYQVAKADRPDHPGVFHATAMAQARAGQWLDAMATVSAGLQAPKRSGNFDGSERILTDDLRQLAAAWLYLHPGRLAELSDHAKQTVFPGQDVGTKPVDGGLALAQQARDQALVGVRFILTWETDANDVDFHVVDGYGDQAFYGNRTLPSGGELYADITTGYGPESFAIRKPCAFPYRLWAHYFSMGPMGFGMGRVQVIRFDGARFQFEERPFVITRDHAEVQLGVVEAGAGDPAGCSR